MELGRNDEAAESFELASENLSEEPGMRLYLGKSLLDLGRHAKAAELLRDESRIEPNRWEPWWFLGVAESAIGNLEAALKARQEVVTLEPAWAEARALLGESLYDVGLYDQARDTLTDALERRHDMPRALHVLGSTLIALNDFSGAVEEFQRAIDHNPQMVESYDSMALAYSYLGKHDVAVTTIQEALKIAPDFTHGRIHLAQLYYVLGKVEGTYEIMKTLDHTAAQGVWDWIHALEDERGTEFPEPSRKAS